MKYRFNVIYASDRRTVPQKLAGSRIDFNDLTIVHEGTLSYIIDGNAFTVSAGEAMYCPDGASRYRLKGTAEAVYTSINFRCSPEKSLKLPYHMENVLSPELAVSLENAVRCFNRGGEYDKAKSDAYASLVAYTLLEQTLHTEENNYVTEMKNYIAHSWDRKITLEEIAESVHLSQSYSSALFKNETGSSIMEYIIDLRIQKACEMLKYSDRSVTEIAESAGFCDIFYFSRMFKKSLGTSPTAYRLREKDNF